LRELPNFRAVNFTAAYPEKPLYLPKYEWQALLAASGPVDIEDWLCGDHGAETQTEVHLQWSAKGIDETRRKYNCPSHHQTRKLIKESPL
jgi:hypothetical protein